MYQVNLLSYKLHYVLGFSDEALHAMFKELHQIAIDSKYWEPLTVSRKYRAYSYLYFNALRFPMAYIPGEEFKTRMDTLAKPYLEGTDVDPFAIMGNCGGYRAFINAVSEEATKLVPAMYDELKVGLDFYHFDLFVRIRHVYSEEYEIYKQLLKSGDSRYSACFIEPRLFCFNSVDMFSAVDKSLRTVLTAVTGQPITKTMDHSELCATLNERDSASFTPIDKIMSESKSVYMITSKLKPERRDYIVNSAEAVRDSDTVLRLVADMPTFYTIYDSLPEESKDVTVIVRLTAQGLAELKTKCPKARVVLLLPVTAGFYKSLRSGEWEDVTLLSY